MGVTDRLQAAWGALRADSRISLEQLASFFSYNNNVYGYSPGFSQTLSGPSETIEDSFSGYVSGAYKSNPVIFACILARLMLFTEARFQFRRLQSGRPGELFGSTALYPLEHPWPSGTTSDLLGYGLLDADMAGNFFAVRRGEHIHRLRPDWVTMVLGSMSDRSVQAGDIDAELIGLLYYPGGRHSGRTPDAFTRGQFAHFRPLPDPTASYRGMSWLTPVVRELQADNAATTHKLKYFENGATPNLVVKINRGSALNTPAKFKEWVTTFRMEHESSSNAFKTLFLDDLTDITTVGSNFEQIQFKATQGAGETRIAAAAGVPPIIAGFSEGLSAATYSNYGQARRRFADLTMRPLWRNFASSMSTIIDVPGGAELWYDDRDISFLKEDLKDASEIQQTTAATILTLTNAGFKPDDVVDAVMAGDLQRLRGKHTGLYSVQLQPPTEKKEPPLLTDGNGIALGNGNKPDVKVLTPPEQ
jgi:hypothetical protein